MYIRRPLCFASAVFALLLFIFATIFPVDLPENVNRMNRTEIVVVGILADKEIKDGNLKLEISKAKVETEKVADLATGEGIVPLKYKIVVQIPYNEEYMNRARIGSRIRAKGTFKLYDSPQNDGEYDARRNNIIKGFCGYISGAKIMAVSDEYSWMRENLYRLRLRFCSIFDKYMSEEDSSVMKAVILGDKTELDPDTKELYVDAGIAHILSLSGLHIAAVGLCILKMLRKMPVNMLTANVLASIIMLGYAQLTGMSLSTVRALIMFVICILAEQIGRTYDLLTAASLAGVIILIGNPYLVCDSGFGLSFGAVIGIACVYPYMKNYANLINLSKFLQTQKHTGFSAAILSFLSQIFDKAVDGITASISITLATLPIILSSFYKINLYSTILNIIVIPLMSILLLCGILSICIWLIIGNSFPPKYLLMAASNILKLYKKCALLAVKAPGSTAVIGRPGLVLCIAYYLAIIAAIVLIELGIDRNVPIIYMLVSIAILIGKITHPAEIVQLAVGQGDCAVIMGADVPVIVIDGGSSSEKNIGRYTIKPFLLSKGIKNIDYMIISHDDSDHVNGLMELLSDTSGGIVIKEIIISRISLKLLNEERSDNLTSIIEMAEQKNIDIELMSAGDRLSGDKFELACLSPGDVSTGDANDDSLVLKFRHYDTDFTALFTGDIAETTEKTLVAECQRDNAEYLDSMLKADYLKVSHHGSGYSSSDDFLSRVKPSVAVISVPEKSVYGHPHKETVERLTKAGARIIRTDEAGQVSIYPARGGIAYECFKHF